MPKNHRTQASAGKARRLSAEEYRVLAEHADGAEADQRRHDRHHRLKRAAGVPQRQWTTTQQVMVANRQEQAATRATKVQRAAADRPDGEQFWNQQRTALIRRRNRFRRKPWNAALASIGLGLAGHGVVTLFTATTSVDPRLVAAVFAAFPVVTAASMIASSEKRYQQQLSHIDPNEQATPLAPAYRRFWPEFLAGTSGGAGLVYWIATSGMSWLVLLMVLVITSLIGTRWWKDNPCGPGVPELEPPRPSEPEPVVETQPAEVDAYAQAWKLKLNLGRLTNRSEGDNTVDYDVELPAGTGYGQLVTKVDDIASALGLDKQQVIPKQPVKDTNGWRPNNRARLTIVVRDVVAGQRYWRGPQVTVTPDGTAGVLTNLARFRDGQGEARLTMWNKDGMVPTAVFGGTGGGKSAAMNMVAVGALSTGLMNSIYVDFKGNSSGALRSRARIVVVGRDAVTDVQRLMKLLTDVRIKNDPRDKQFPSRERPGWFTFMDEITKGIKGDPKFAQEMEHTATTVRSLGIWLVASSQDMHSSAWHNTNTRSAFAKQAVVFYMNTDSDQLINGLTYKPSQLPTYDEDEAATGQEEQPIAGFAVHVNTYRANIPCRWDWLPADDDPVEQEPSYRVSAAFDEFVSEPGIAQDEYNALVQALGPPNPDGRWIIGTGGTHTFHKKEDDKTDRDAGQRPVRTTFDFGAPRNQTPASTTEDQTTLSQRRVFQLIEAGTTKRADIVEACGDRMSNAVIDRALNTLVGDGHIQRAKQGHYVVADQRDPTPV